MKSRTSSYKRTWLKKNVERFLPFWGLYVLCLMLGLIMMAGSRDRFYFVMNLGECARMMAIVNLGYALLTAQLLFGDLFNSRMCYGLHALPLRREEIFGINVVSGILFSLVPTFLMALCALPLALSSRMPHVWAVPLLWFGAANLQYLFFFGLAVFCVFCAGNRFSMAVIYGILNFGSLLFYLLVNAIYMPMLPGVGSTYDWSQNLCPVAKISVTPLMLVERMSWDKLGHFEIQSGSWGYLGICAAVGVVLLLVALQMYRKRALETAGEFVAVKALKPVFLILFSLCAATGFNLVVQMFFGSRDGIAYAVAFSLVGLVAGWFVGLMLLEKTASVFSKRAFTGAAVLVAVMAGSLVLTHADLLGIASWVPEPEEVESVYVIPGYSSFGEYWTERENFRLSKEKDLQTVVEIHSLAMEEGLTPEDACWYYSGSEDDRRDGNLPYTVPVSLEYHMKNGAVRRRYYYMYADGPAGQLAEKLYSNPNMVLRQPEILDYSGGATWINVGGYGVPEEYLAEEDVKQLLYAIRMDGLGGNLAQMQEFHTTPVWKDDRQMIPSLSLSVGIYSDTIQTDLYLDIYSDSTHVMTWLQDRNLVSPAISQQKSYS